MATDRPRIQAYIDPELYKHYQDWKQSKGIEKDSTAFNELLREFFGEKAIPSEMASTGLSKEDIEELIAEECEIGLREIKEEVASKLPTIPEINAKAEAQAQAWMDAKSEEWMERLGQKFCDRIYALERKLQGLENGKLEKLVEGATAAYSSHWMEGLNSRLEQLDKRLKSAENLLDVKGGVPTLFQEALQTVQMQSYVIEALESELKNKLPGESPDGARSPQEPLIIIQEQTQAESSDSESIDQGELPSELPSELTQTELAKRLDCNKSQISRKKGAPDFEEWTRERDPEAIAWKYDENSKKYIAMY